MRPRTVALARLRYVFLCVLALAISACGTESPQERQRSLPDADSSQGRDAFVAYGCSGCHAASGIRGADVRVGPSLHDFRDQTYIAGRLPNDPDNLIAWIQQPQSIAPGSAMPDLGVSDEDARNIAAYLYSQ